MNPSFRALCQVLMGLVVFSPPLLTHATPAVGATQDAFQRPAISVAKPHAAVMLGATQAGSRLVAVGERGLVILSDDGGHSWRQAPTPVSVTLTAVRFADSQRGVAVGHGGVVLTSIDAGESWQLRLDGRRAAQLALDAATAAADAALVASAQMLVEEGPDKPFLDVLLKGEGEMLVVGAYGLAFRSTDFGQSWQSAMGTLDNPEGLHLNSVRMRGDRVVIAGERGLVLQSVDGGKTFARLETPYKGSFFTAELPADGVIVLAGLRGNVWHSADGGASWQGREAPAGASITGSAVLDDGGVVFASQAGLVLTWSADGAIRPLAGETRPGLNALVRASGNRLMLLSVLGVSAIDLPAGDKEATK